MSKKDFEDYEINEVSKSSSRTITESDIVNFAGISGDFNRLHTNKMYMENSKFGGRIAHGLLIYSVARGLLFRLSDKPDTIAFYGIDKIRFIKPVFIHDTINVEEKVVNKEVRDEESGIITFEDKVFNQRDELILIGYPKVLISRV